VFHWRTDAKAVELNKDISLPEYDLKGVSQMVCSQKINSTGLAIYSTYNFLFSLHGFSSFIYHCLLRGKEAFSKNYFKLGKTATSLHTRLMKRIFG